MRLYNNVRLTQHQRPLHCNQVGFSESAKMTAISKVFNDSYKSPFSVILIDSIERLLGKP